MPLDHYLAQHAGLKAAVLVAGLFLSAWVVGLVVQWIVIRVLHGVALRTRWVWDDVLLEHGVARWLARGVPPLIVQYGIVLIPGVPDRYDDGIARLAGAYLVLCLGLAASALLAGLDQLYREGGPVQRHSLKGLVQLARLIVFIVTGLVMACVISGRQIGLLLSGLGAMSAVLLLVFKDTILGFVAGLQLSTNDMLRVGDWITLPSAGVDGHVLDIGLHAVKVRNFDQTIVTIPTWKLISESYQNWRGMVEAGARRIKRALLLDASSVAPLDPAAAHAIWTAGPATAYLQGTLPGLPGGRSEGDWQATNLGLFRTYAQHYLQQHPRILKELSIVVRQLPMTGQGLPLELWCFTPETALAGYESVQSDIFEHLLIQLPRFGLSLYQQPSGTDLKESRVTGREAAIAAHTS
ncbi:mechanosensitive ion channel family protein [Frateuria aurantia]